MKALVIGGGIFGVCAAIELAKAKVNTDLFESNERLMQGATSVNQNRLHLGYHYPRSIATAKQCLEGLSSFKEYFGSSIVDVGENYYAISKNDSRTSFLEYINFCKKLGLPHKERYPSENILKLKQISGCIITDEKIIDLNKLKIIAEQLLKKYKVNVFLKREFNKGKEKDYDIVINATYSNFNVINKMLGLATRKFRYDVCNVPVLNLPKDLSGIGITIMDGDFHSILPYGKGPYHLFWSVKDSIIRTISTSLPKKFPLKIADYKDDRYIPLLRYAKLVDVLRITKILRPDVELSDERVTDLVNYGNGKFAILSAKLNTCVLTARNLVSIINNDH